MQDTPSPASADGVAAFPAFPTPTPLCRILCDVGPLVSLGAAPLGERRFVQLLGGRVEGPCFQGVVMPGGVDWQIARQDEVLEIDARYVLELSDGARVEVESRGLRHGAPEVMQRLAAGEPVASHRYFFRTAIRLTTGAPAWRHLNRIMAVGMGSRFARQVVIDVFQVH
ncbi:DUF3237 family protein [Xylophilus sp. Kf1]|nr:DUF3237 family protein [Xylophilus sp. Kf1]